MFAVAQADGSLSVDFHNELYPEAKLLLDWENPFPRARTPTLQYGHNLIWPPLAAFLVAPFTLLSPDAADWAIAIVGLALLHALAADRRRPRLARVRRRSRCGRR